MDTVDLFDALQPEDKRLAYQHAVMMLRESDADRDRLAAELAAIKAEVGPLLGRLANYIGRWPATLLSERYAGDADAEVARAWAARLGKEE